MYTESGECWNGLSTAWQFHVFSHRFVSSYSPENPTHPCRSPACPNQPILDIIARQAARQQQHQHHHSFNSSSPLSPSHVSVDRSVCFSARLSLYLRLLFAIRATHHELTEILLFLHNPTIIPFGGHPNYVFVSSRRIGTKPISKCLSLAGWSHFFSVLSTDAVWLQFVRITRFNDWLVVVL